MERRRFFATIFGALGLGGLETATSAVAKDRQRRSFEFVNVGPYGFRKEDWDQLALPLKDANGNAFSPHQLADCFYAGAGDGKVWTPACNSYAAIRKSCQILTFRFGDVGGNLHRRFVVRHASVDHRDGVSTGIAEFWIPPTSNLRGIQVPADWYVGRDERCGLGLSVMFWAGNGQPPCGWCHVDIYPYGHFPSHIGPSPWEVGEQGVTEKQAIEDSRNLVVRCSNSGSDYAAPFAGKTRAEVDEFRVHTSRVTYHGKRSWVVSISLPGDRAWSKEYPRAEADEPREWRFV